MRAQRVRYEWSRHQFRVYARVGKHIVGAVMLQPDGSIESIGLDPEFRHKGIGTQLYQRAAAMACSEIGEPLRSDMERSGYSQAFWEKQVRKGRARCESPTRLPAPTGVPIETVTYGRGQCTRYVLSCPAPKSLAYAARAVVVKHPLRGAFKSVIP